VRPACGSITDSGLPETRGQRRLVIAAAGTAGLVNIFGVSATVAGSGLLVAGFISAVAIIFARYFLHMQDAPTYGESGIRD
jgi:hypothetical protein